METGPGLVEETTGGKKMIEVWVQGFVAGMSFGVIFGLIALYLHLKNITMSATTRGYKNILGEWYKIEKFGAGPDNR